MASFTKGTKNCIRVLYTVENVVGEDGKNGANAFKITTNGDSVVLFEDFLRLFPLRGYGDDLIFLFKVPNKNGPGHEWIEVVDPSTPLIAEANGTISAKVRMPDNEGFVRNTNGESDQTPSSLPRRPSGTAFVDTSSVVDDSNSSDKGWANFSSNAAVNVAENASKLKEGIKSVASSLSDKLSNQFKNQKSSRRAKKGGKRKGDDKSKSVEKRDRYYRQLYQFYSLHNPDKINSIDEILDRYAGREDALFATLQRKYGGGIDRNETVTGNRSSNAEKAETSSAVETVKKGFWNVFSATKAIAGTVLSAVSQDEVLQVGNHKVFVERELAEGGFSKVYLVRDNDTGRKFALKKMVAQSREQLDEAKWEMKIHRELDHPNILKIIDASILPSPRSKNMQEINILLPLASHGSIFDLIEGALDAQKSNNNGKGWPFPEQEALRIFLKVCESVKVMHKKGYAHRDIKPHNILLFDHDQQTGEPSDVLVPILMDLGSTANLKFQVRTRKDVLNLQDLAASKCSPPYRAPELTEVKLDVDVDGRSDVFSLGGKFIFQACFSFSEINCRRVF